MAFDRDKVLKIAQKLVDKKRFDKAIEEYRKVVQRDPKDVRTLLKIGDLHLKLEQYEEAITTYEQVGEHYDREGFSVKAIAVFKQIRGIIRRHASHLENRYGHIVPRLAEIYNSLGLTSDALAAYDQVATRLRQDGRERDALDIFKKVVELDPSNPISHLRVADSRARLGDIDQAVEAFGRAAEIMVELGRTDDALKVLNRLLDLRKDAKFARLAGEIHLKRGQATDGMAALRKLQVAFKADPKDLKTLKVLASAFDAIEQPAKGVEVLKEAARLALKTEQFDEAETVLSQLEQRVPGDKDLAKIRAQQAKLQREQAAVGETLGIDEAELDNAATGDGVDLHADPMGGTIEMSDDGDGDGILIEESMDEFLEIDDDDVMSVGEQSARPSSTTLFTSDAASENSAVRRLVHEAERQRDIGQLEQAIGLLGDGLRNLGSSRLLRALLSDMLLEAGQDDEAIHERLMLAHELAVEHDSQRALQLVDEVLMLRPEQPDALRIRHYLTHPPETSDEPLVSYDVESGGVDAALNRAGENPLSGQYQLNGPQGPSPGERNLLDEQSLDEAEALANQGQFEEARQLLNAQLARFPNHPLVLDRLADIEAMAAHAGGGYGQPYGGAGYHPAPGYPQANYGYGTAPQQHGYPQHGTEAATGYAANPHGTAPTQADAGYAAPAGYAETSAPTHGYDPAGHSAAYEGQAYDGQGAEATAATVQDHSGDRPRPQPSPQTESESKTHFDLGVAYMEMGLQSDAISELTMAARDPHRECTCLSMIGTIHLQIGDLDAALDAMHRALNTQFKTREQELALGYEIANIYEMKGMPQQAMHYFEWLAKLDANYSDPRGGLHDRIQRIRSGSGTQRVPGAPEQPIAASGHGGNDELGSS